MDTSIVIVIGVACFVAGGIVGFVFGALFNRRRRDGPRLRSSMGHETHGRAPDEQASYGNSPDGAEIGFADTRVQYEQQRRKIRESVILHKGPRRTGAAQEQNSESVSALTTNPVYKSGGVMEVMSDDVSSDSAASTRYTPAEWLTSNHRGVQETQVAGGANCIPASCTPEADMTTSGSTMHHQEDGYNTGSIVEAGLSGNRQIEDLGSSKAERQEQEIHSSAHTSDVNERPDAQSHGSPCQSPGTTVHLYLDVDHVAGSHLYLDVDHVAGSAEERDMTSQRGELALSETRRRKTSPTHDYVPVPQDSVASGESASLYEYVEHFDGVSDGHASGRQAADPNATEGNAPCRHAAAGQAAGGYGLPDTAPAYDYVPVPQYNVGVGVGQRVCPYEDVE